MSNLLQNRYQIGQVINRGGMGIVYLAFDKRLNLEVAIKEFRPETFTETTEQTTDMLVKAFQSEAHLQASLSHPAIPKVSDYFEENGGHYLVMDLAKGMSLEKIITYQHQNVEFSQKLDWFKQLLNVVEYLHTLDNPVIHRDIKPTNIKVNSKGKLFLLDFGISKETINSHPLSHQTLQFATLEFAPLEQSIQASEHIKNSLMTINSEKQSRF